MKLLTLLVLLLSAPFPLYAAVTITEIMYDLPGADTKHEWIEVMNDGEPVNLSEWKLFEGGSNHKLTVFSGNETVPQGGYAILADNPTTFLADHPGFSGVVFDVALSGGLNNTNGETLTLRDEALTDRDTVSYSPALGAAGDGNSLNKVGGAWQALLPTPGSSPSNAPLPPKNKPESTKTTETINQETGMQPSPTVKTAEDPVTETLTTTSETSVKTPPTKITETQETHLALTPQEVRVTIEEPKNIAGEETENLTASVALSDTAQSSHNTWLWFVGLGALIVLGIGAVLLVKKKKPNTLS